MKMARHMTRRSAFKLGAAATALPLVHIRTVGAAGKLSLALWDHWVPTGNDAMRKLVDAWAQKNKVDVQLDLLTSVGSKINITMAAEAQARAGHDVYAFDQWTVHEYSEKLDPVDDIMKSLIAKYGKIARAVEYLGVANGHWMAVPVGWGSTSLPACARISMMKRFADIDVQAWYPAHEGGLPEAPEWTYETQLKAAEACAKAGFPFGFGCGSGSTDANLTWGATFGAFGADVMDAKGNITIDSDNVKMVLDYCKKIVRFLPSNSVSYDDASNNRALISGKSALIWNPPSAWAVAKRDAPEVAADCWTFPNPKGPKGRLVPARPYFWGIWSFAKNKSAGKDLIAHLSQREQVEALAAPVAGYDLPPFLSMSDLNIWSEVKPPKGTIFNYPIRPWHGAEYYIPGSSASPEIAVQMWNNSLIPGMVARLVSGQTIKQTIAWAKDELEGFVRRI
jgi:ABC-type glycerol-3-phosphate transport system substrate-binding protein